jgi:hypothetical protein
MEYNQKSGGRWSLKKAILLAFFSISACSVQAQLIPPPTITVQPTNTTVQNGDTGSFYVSAYCTLGIINSVTWLCNGKAVSATNITVTVGGGGLLTTTITSTLTVSDASTANAGKYSVEIASLLSGTVTSDVAALTVVPSPAPVAVNVVSAGTGMVSKGFKLEFSGPAGSNLVMQASSDLTGWSSLCTNEIGASGTVSWTDTVAKAYPCRFYRAKLK